jgi:hypothetical protein
MEKFARRCDATGKGINEGYVVCDGEFYFSSKDDLIKHLSELDWEDCNGNHSTDCKTNDALLEFFYNEDYYYYTEWEEIDDDCYYDAEGNEYENND